MLPAFVIHQSRTLKRRFAFLKAKLRLNFYTLTKITPVKWSMDTSLENEIFWVKKGVKSGDTVFSDSTKISGSRSKSGQNLYLISIFQKFRP